MKFTPSEIPDAYIIDIDKFEDERGFFARTWCRNEFAEHALTHRLVQCNLSYNHQMGTLRGMHMQTPPFKEAKLVRCIRGGIWDVIVDLRPESPTYLEHVALEMTDENRRMLYVPEGFLHGFITLTDHAEVFYQMTEFYSPEHAMGFRYDDPAFDIQWPVAVQVISKRDKTYPDYTVQATHSIR